MVMSTGFDPTDSATVLRRKRDGTRSAFPCPAPCAAYNEHMGGVDRGDQLRGYYAYNIKSRKFYKYIANFLQGVAVVNSLILYRAGHPTTKINLKKFQGVLARQLIGGYCSRRRAGRGSQQLRPLPLRHFPTKTPSSNSERKRGRCSLCHEKKRRSDTQWFCVECGIWLCHPGTSSDCFLLWHKRM